MSSWTPGEYPIVEHRLVIFDKARRNRGRLPSSWNTSGTKPTEKRARMALVDLRRLAGGGGLGDDRQPGVVLPIALLTAGSVPGNGPDPPSNRCAQPGERKRRPGRPPDWRSIRCPLANGAI